VISQPHSNGFWCSTCHDTANFPDRYAINTVTFPSKKVVSFGEGSDGNLCITCHQGRESKASLDGVIKASGLGDDEVMTPEKRLNFRNVTTPLAPLHHRSQVAANTMDKPMLAHTRMW
jgi:hypothetical protein